ncbi:MAG TPA: PTS sugar transporter subunit IIA [Candidatus Deferrimicrobiaceae bacterium]|jgi:two-component system sensor histidine kinase KdpD
MLLEERADSFLRMIRRAERGRLKIYLGYCPGVGKTYQMLLEGHRLREEGIDVVIGYLETHGRAEIAKLAEGLEVIPRRRTEYRGVPLEEMDVDAVLERKPQVALVDELAHTNVPGSGNAKRYQDIQDILASGIHVITTLNIQHMESLYDTVESAVHVRVRERLPDNIVSEADQIVNVDVTTEDLLKRLKEGKIYKADRIGTAMSNFFKTSNLEKLRELALREMASQIDLRRREAVDEEIAAAPDQVMVALSSRGPNSEMLLRYASRLAGKLNRNWYAVYVQTPSEEPTVIDAHTQRILSGTLTLAKQLGATVFTYKGEDIPATILRFAKEYRVGTIVVGTPTPKPFWKTLWRKTTVERLIHEAKGFTVVVLDTSRDEPTAIKVPEEAPRPPVTAPSVPVSPGPPAFSGFISAERIVIWDEPVDRDMVLRTLAEAAVAGRGEAYLNLVLTSIAKREEQGSTFLNEGVALPHARIEGLVRPVVAIGLTRKGVSDVSTEKPIEYIFMILSPAEVPEVQIQILAQVSRASRNRELVRNLGKCRTPQEVFAAVRDWETPQVAAPSLPN